MEPLLPPPSKPKPANIMIDNNNNSTAYRDFIHSIKSPSTKLSYSRALNYFMQFMRLKEGDYNSLLSREPKLIQSDIIDFIVYIKDQKKLAPASISSYAAGVQHFFSMNDIILNWKKINSFKGEYREVIEDQPYTREQIKQLLDKAEQRNRALILLLTSSGIRVGSISDLKIGNLASIDKYNIYQITVYKKSRSKYITFCSAECRKEIDIYLQYRERCGEKLTKDSPLFRTTFDRTDLLQSKSNVKPLSTSAISWILNELLNITGVRPAVKMTEGMKHNQRTNLMQCHGFRKFFDTTCTLAGMDALYIEKLMGHNIGIKGRYFLPKPAELLEGNDKKLGYISVIDALTIDESNRLKVKVEQLEVREKTEISTMQDQISQLRSLVEDFIVEGSVPGILKKFDRNNEKDRDKVNTCLSIIDEYAEKELKSSREVEEKTSPL